MLVFEIPYSLLVLKRSTLFKKKILGQVDKSGDGTFLLDGCWYLCQCIRVYNFLSSGQFERKCKDPTQSL